jgi:hypothetical protein
MKSHTTATQLLECTNDWSEEIENGNCIDVGCIDFCRAFDNVSISKLMYKLSCYGFSEKLHAWLSNFLSDTIFCIKINACTLTCFEQLSGILQGSVLGTFCFNVYINDITKCVRHNTCKLYGDDAKVYNSFNEAVSSNNLQTALDSIAA